MWNTGWEGWGGELAFHLAFLLTLGKQNKGAFFKGAHCTVDIQAFAGPL